MPEHRVVTWAEIREGTLKRRCDSSKFGRIAGFILGGLNDIRVVRPPAQYKGERLEFYLQDNVSVTRSALAALNLT